VWFYISLVLKLKLVDAIVSQNRSIHTRPKFVGCMHEHGCVALLQSISYEIGRWGTWMARSKCRGALESEPERLLLLLELLTPGHVSCLLNFKETEATVLTKFGVTSSLGRT
jgi:hypothetical protein